MSELDFLNVNLDRIFKAVPVNHDAEICFVVEVGRAADVIQRRGFNYSVFVLRLLGRVRHQNYEDVIDLSEIRQLVEQFADVLRFIPVSLLALQSVVWVNYEGFNAPPPDEEFGFFEDCIYSEIICWADEVKVIFEVFFYQPIFPEFKRFLAEFLAGKLLYQLGCVIGERGVFGAELCESPPVPHIEPFGNFVDELRFTAARNTCYDAEAFGLE